MNQVINYENIDNLHDVLINGDLSKLSNKDRVYLVLKVCESQGLNALTKPFEFIALNGKLTLYAKKDATDQLRKIHGVSITVLSREEIDGLYVVTVSAKDKNVRQDEDIGAVPIGGLRGEARCYAIAKAMTKAKRRVTLSFCGLGWLDETEVESIPGAEKVTTTLDETFPDVDPPVVGTGLAGTPVPKKPEAPPAALKGSDKDIALTYLDDTCELLDNREVWAKVFREEREKIVNDLSLTPAERMHNINGFKKMNQDILMGLPKSWSKKIENERLAINRKLGKQKDDTV